MGVTEIMNASTVPDLIIGLDPTGLLFSLVLYACMTIFIIGWSYNKGISHGLLVGGFFTVLAGFGMLLLELIPMSTLIIPVTLLCIGALLLGFDVGKKD